MKEDDILSLKALLAHPKKIVIIPHKNPDGDAMGSSLALLAFFKKQNHNTTVVAPNEYPDFLKWMPGDHEVIKYEHHPELATRKVFEADLIFTVDFNSLERLDEMKTVVEKAKADFVMIDHHRQPEGYAKFTYSDASLGSTCEMVFNFINFLSGAHLIDENIATCLYTGIMTDTGNFRFPATTAQTHLVTAALIDKGAKPSEIYNAVFDTNTPERLKLLGRALNNMVVLEHLNTAYITLSKAELEEFSFKKGDTEGFVNYGLSLKGIKLAVFFAENTTGEQFVKISFRSKGSFDVNAFARNHFNGGGHINAAGGKSIDTMENTVNRFLELLNGYKKELSA